jgi:(2R)-ethylmalonyl-CoA mutase
MAKGQTGLSIAFDLPTQTGYDSDHILAHGEVGKLGVPLRNYEDMEVLFDQIPLKKCRLWSKCCGRLFQIPV